VEGGVVVVVVVVVFFFGRVCEGVKKEGRRKEKRRGEEERGFYRSLMTMKRAALLFPETIVDKRKEACTSFLNGRVFLVVLTGRARLS
jgi:hypothetical protein